MKDLHQDGGGLIGAVVLVVLVVIFMLLLMVLYNDVQHLIGEIEKLFHPFGGSSCLGSPETLLQLGQRLVSPP